MSRLIDLTGKRFTRLTVINRSYPNTKRFRARWKVKCDCGVEKIVDGGNLRNGVTKSCGCLHREAVSLILGLANMRSRIANYKFIAKKKGLEYNLTEEQFAKIAQQNCYYCRSRPDNISDSHNCNGTYIYNGLDRVDNTKGYIIDNIVPCCHFCNEAKSNHTLQEFKDWIERVYNNLFEDKEGQSRV